MEAKRTQGQETEEYRRLLRLLQPLLKEKKSKPRKRKRSDPERRSPFQNWDAYDPTPKMGIWRELHEHTILRALESERKLRAVESVLSSDLAIFCEGCEAMKCYDSIYPICEPALEKLREIVRS